MKNFLHLFFRQKEFFNFNDFVLLINGWSTELVYCFYDIIESGLMNFLKNLAKPTDIFIDIGAHIGYYTIGLSKKVKKVICFEPYPENLRKLRQNIRINQCKNVIVEPYAISDIKGCVKLYKGNDSFTPSLLNAQKSGFHVSVPSTTLDEYIFSKGMEPTIIKIDVEGHEINVLRGMKRVIEIYRPKIIIEIHPISFKFKDWSKIFRFLKKYYSFHLLWNGKIIKIKNLKTTLLLKNKYKMQIYPHWVFIPK